jgi:hypothetical protein
MAGLQTSHPVTSGLPQRGLKPASVLAACRPHGDRLRYVAGCRCDLCREANTLYSRERTAACKEGDWNGIVSAAPARAHLIALSEAGVGRRAVAAASDVGNTVLMDIRSGKKPNIRARTARMILAVTPEMASDHALIDAAPTWKLVNAMLAGGFTKGRIAKELGATTMALQLGREQITVRNAHRILALHTRLMASDEVLVAAAPSLKLIEELRDEGFSDKQLARLLGNADDELRIGKTSIPRGLESRVRTLYERLTA